MNEHRRAHRSAIAGLAALTVAGLLTTATTTIPAGANPAFATAVAARQGSASPQRVPHMVGSNPLSLRGRTAAPEATSSSGGGASTRQFRSSTLPFAPVAVAGTPDSSLWAYGHDTRLIHVSPLGIVTTIEAAAGGTLFDPNVIAADSAGNAWFAAAGTGVRKVTAAGVVTTVPVPGGVSVLLVTVAATGRIVFAGVNGSTQLVLGDFDPVAQIVTSVVVASGIPRGLTPGEDRLAWAVTADRVVGLNQGAVLNGSFAVPSAISARGITVGGDHALWLTGGANHVPRVSISGAILSDSPFFYDDGFQCQTFGVVTGPDGAVYVTCADTEAFLRFSPDGGLFGSGFRPGSMLNGISVVGDGDLYAADRSNIPAGDTSPAGPRVVQIPRGIPFIRHLYADVLGRTADPVGLSFWVTQWWETDRSDFGYGQLFGASLEYRRTLVLEIYTRFLHRSNPDEGGISYWAEQLRLGVPPNHMRSLFVGTDDYFANVAGGTVSGFVDNAYLDILGRSTASDPDGKAFWEGRINAGLTRQAMASQLLFSGEALGKVVDSVYTRFLGRGTDAAGRDFWVGQLQNGLTELDLAASLVDSEEYYFKL